MKIAFIGQKGIPAKSGGVDRHVESLAFFLAKKELELIVYNRKGYLNENTKELEGITTISLPFINTQNLAAISHGFLATLDAIKRKVDIIHYHGIGPCLLAWIPKIFSPKIKIVATLHSFDYGNDKWGSFAKLMLRLGERMMVKYADQIIVLTTLMKDYLYQRYNRDAVVIQNGALIKQSDDKRILAEFKLEEKKYLVSISRLIRLKGIQYLINVFKKLKLENKIAEDFKLAIVGDGEYEAELRKLANDDNDIVFCGNQSGDNLSVLYSNSALFIQSSEMEGLSISLLEAMAHGLTILASDISANYEAGADSIYYFKSKDENDLAVKLVNILNNQEEMEVKARKAKERAETVFNWEVISNKIWELYHRL